MKRILTAFAGCVALLCVGYTLYSSQARQQSTGTDSAAISIEQPQGNVPILPLHPPLQSKSNRGDIKSVTAVEAGPSPTQSNQSDQAAASQALISRIQAIATQERFAAQQLAIRSAACTEDTCNLEFSLPPFVTEARNRDSRVVADLLAQVQSLPEYKDRSVSVTHVSHGANGMTIGLAMSAGGDPKGRFYSNDEIAKIRMQTIIDYENQLINSKGPGNVK